MARSRSRMTQQSSGDTTKSGLAISIREASPDEGEADLPPDTPAIDGDPQGRWSWTNSQACPTPRMYASSMRSSQSRLPRFRTVSSWVRTQSNRQEDQSHARQPPPASPTKLMPILKNKASMPNLAPRPITRKLSKMHRRQSSSMSALTPAAGKTVPGPSIPLKEDIEQRLKDQGFLTRG